MKILIYSIFCVLIKLLPLGMGGMEKVSADKIGIAIIGAIVGNQKSKGNVALIKELTSGKVRAVKVNFNILGNHRILEIAEKFMIVETKDKKKVQVYRYSVPASSSPIRAPIPKINSSLIADKNFYSEDGFERKNNKVRITDEFRKNLLNKELAKVLMQATAVPNLDGNSVDGWKMMQIDQGSIYDKAGVKDGDVITGVNGKALRDASSAIKILNRMRTAENIEFEVIRNGTPTSLSIQVGS